MSEWRAETRLCMICGTRGFRARDSSVELADGRTMYHEKACTFHELGELRADHNEAIDALRNLYNTCQDVLAGKPASTLYEDNVLLNAEGVLARYEEANE